MADLVGNASDALPPPPPQRPKIFSISCSFFLDILAKLYVGAPSPGGLAPSYREPWIRSCISDGLKEDNPTGLNSLS